MRIFDAHCDTLSEMYSKKQNFAKNNLHLDLARMEKYDRYTQVFAVFIPPEQKSRAKKYFNELAALFYKQMSLIKVF